MVFHWNMVSRWMIGVACLGMLAFAESEDSVLKPVSVCDVAEKASDYDGRAVAVLGRFSFRKEGRWMGQDGCRSSDANAETVISLAYSQENAPRIERGYEIDRRAVNDKLQTVKQHTHLRKFRFGTPDYDRWAVVYGRFKLADKAKQSAAALEYAGDGYVMFLPE